MQREDYDRLYRRMLLDLWHAKDSDLDGIAAQVANDDLVIRQNGAEQHGVRALADLVRQGRAAFTDVTVAIETGPLIDRGHVAARWSFSGRYTGGIPGAKPPRTRRGKTAQGPRGHAHHLHRPRHDPGVRRACRRVLGLFRRR